MNIRSSIPSFGNPYNMPIHPQKFKLVDSDKPGVIYDTTWGTAGFCSDKQAVAGKGFDFVCPKGQPCYSQTSEKVGYYPQQMCGHVEQWQQTSAGPVPTSTSIW